MSTADEHGGWSLRGEPTALLPGVVTLVEGTTFCVSDEAGDLRPDAAMGLFFRDTRILSRWALRVDDERLLPMACQLGEPFTATFVARCPPTAGRADSTTLVTRHRSVGDGMHETIVVENLGQVAETRRLTLVVDGDFADLFAVKEARAASASRSTSVVEDGALHVLSADTPQRGVHLQVSPPADILPGSITWQVELGARESRTFTVSVGSSIDGRHVTPRHTGDDRVTRAASRMRDWRRQATVVMSGDSLLEPVFQRSVEDLGVLRVFDPQHPDRVAVAAGAPWFMAVFGRDSLLTAWMLLPVDRRLALGTLQTLADHQGSRTVPRTEEQPGKILHEIRFGPDAHLALGGASTYYGSVDATPLFVMLLGELHRWGADWDDIGPLLPHADAALEWLTQDGDRDGDGFVEYARSHPDGLLNQGWKDSFDGITFADGRVAEPPIALAEVQGYTYAAYRARASLARAAGEDDEAVRWEAAAAQLKERFNATFWLPGQRAIALGLDAAKRPIDSVTSNQGHCLWTGILDQDKAEAVAEHLLSPEMFTGWGVRTLATSAAAYNPMSYHNGSVWPHDNAILAAGLARYGLHDHAARVATAQLEAAHAFGGRLPELFCGFDRTAYAAPVPYPAACSPQAWASGAPFLLLRTLLGLEPDIPGNVVRLAPAVPAQYLPLTVDNVLLALQRTRIRVSPGTTDVSPVPPGLTVAGA